jgi:integrase
MSQKLVLTTATQKFVNAVAADSPSTGAQYGRRVYNFGLFLKQKYNISIDEYLKSYKQFDVYDILSAYHVYLKQTRLNRNTISARLRTAKTFLEYYDIPIIESQFRIKVRAPKQKVTERFQALTKKLVNKIIIGCQSPRLHTYVLCLAATGMRATEPLSILTKHVDFENGVMYLRAEHTKTRQNRTVFLTKECLAQLKVWKDYRERERRVVGKNGKVVYATKALRPNDLFFSTGRINNADEQDPDYMYHVLAREFSTALDRIGLSDRNTESKRHEITLHSFRRFVYSTITDLGFHDFANFFIGHAGSTYWRKTESEKLDLFRKVEPYLTYLDYSELEAKGADVETKLDEKDQQIATLQKQMNDMAKALLKAGLM